MIERDSIFSEILPDNLDITLHRRQLLSDFQISLPIASLNSLMKAAHYGRSLTSTARTTWPVGVQNRL